MPRRWNIFFDFYIDTNVKKSYSNSFQIDSLTNRFGSIHVCCDKYIKNMLPISNATEIIECKNKNFLNSILYRFIDVRFMATFLKCRQKICRCIHRFESKQRKTRLRSQLGAGSFSFYWKDNRLILIYVHLKITGAPIRALARFQLNIYVPTSSDLA